MAIPKIFEGLKVPAIAAPMFLASGPDLVVETCRGGVVGTFPALNLRSTEAFSQWLDAIEGRLGPGDAPFGVNLIAHKTNPRLQADLEEVVRHKVPLVITSLGAVPDLVDAVHAYGGLVFHDVINRRHAEKAAQAGVDGIIAVCAGAGGHSGLTSPFALATEIREVFDGTIVLSGALNTGAQIAAVRVMGADMAYLGTRFLATKEAMVANDYKQMVVDASAADILYTPNISGINANFLRPSIKAAGLDPDHLVPHAEMALQNGAKAWSTIWSAGQGTGGIHDLPSAGALCQRLADEYRAAMRTAASDTFAAQGHGR